MNIILYSSYKHDLHLWYSRWHSQLAWSIICLLPMDLDSFATSFVYFSWIYIHLENHLSSHTSKLHSQLTWSIASFLYFSWTCIHSETHLSAYNTSTWLSQFSWNESKLSGRTGKDIYNSSTFAIYNKWRKTHTYKNFKLSYHDLSICFIHIVPWTISYNKSSSTYILFRSLITWASFNLSSHLEEVKSFNEIKEVTCAIK